MYLGGPGNFASRRTMGITEVPELDSKLGLGCRNFGFPKP